MDWRRQAVVLNGAESHNDFWRVVSATPNGCLEPVMSRTSGLTTGLLMDVHLLSRTDSWDE